MSTTNPEQGRVPADPVGGLAPIPHGTPLADDHDVSGPPAAETIARGHEIDSYDTTSVFSVPLLVVLFFVLAFGTVSVIFYFIFPTPEDPKAHPMAVEDNQRAIPDRHNDVPNPPLDNFRHLQGNARSITSLERPIGNSPWIHPEDLRVNPDNTPTLFRGGWLDAGKTRARLSIDDAIAIAARKDSAVLKTSATPAAPIASQNLSTAANAGRGEGSSAAPPPRDPLSPKEAAPGKAEGKKGKGKGKK
jgi:hypothetical protein